MSRQISLTKLYKAILDLTDKVTALEAKLTTSQQPDNDVEVMLTALLERKLPTSTREFIQSLSDYYEEFDFLTERQQESLKRNYDRFVHGIPF